MLRSALLLLLLLTLPAAAAERIYGTPAGCALFRSGGVDAVKASHLPCSPRGSAVSTCDESMMALLVTDKGFAGAGYFCAFKEPWSDAFRRESECAGGDVSVYIRESQDGRMFFESDQDFVILNSCP